MSSEDLSNQSPLPSTARRRLLRGVMAGAAVLPVGAGATAVASNLRCVSNVVDTSTLPDSVVGGRSGDKLAADGISRIALYKSTKSYMSGTTQVTLIRYWVKGADLIALKGTAVVSVPSGVTSGIWFLSSSTRSGDVLGATSGTPETHLTSGWSTPTQDSTGTEKYVAVRFDNAGNILGTSDNIPNFTTPVNNSAIQRSCWSSFTGVNFSSLS